VTISKILNTNNTWNDPVAVSAQANLAVIKDYYQKVLNRNSFDNKGGRIEAIIHARDASTELYGHKWVSLDDAKYNWYNDCFYFGDGREDYIPLVYGLDVVAHEFTHAVSKYTAGFIKADKVNDKLYLFSQTGALDEAYSDILGNLIENDNDSKWLIGRM